MHRPFPTSLEGRPGGAAVGFASSSPELEAAQRWKRVAAGQGQLATDLFHQHLLTGLGDRTELPDAWRSPQQWGELLGCGAVDAVLLQTVQGSGERPGQREEDRALAGSLGRVVLGRRPLVLACALPAVAAAPIPWLRLLAPPRAAAAGLHLALEDMQLAPVQSCACTTSEQWIARLEEPGTLLPVPADLLLQPPWSTARLTAVSPWEPLWEQLELLVPGGLLQSEGLQELCEVLWQRIARNAGTWQP